MILNNENIDLISKIKIFKQCIIPVLLYGAQVWTLTEKTIKKLETMLRSIINIKRKDKIKNEYIYKKITNKKYNKLQPDGC